MNSLGYGEALTMKGKGDRTPRPLHRRRAAQERTLSTPHFEEEGLEFKHTETGSCSRS